jgi:SAM-dependent methyltransferase
MATRAPVMSTEEVLSYFSSTRVHEVPAFRALCNALKALGIAAAVKHLREVRKGRMVVLDVGGGKGGDLGKWMQHRPKKLILVDGSESCVEEARRRYAAMVCRGRGSMEASFFALDLCDDAMALPVADGGVDVVYSHFFMQFTLSRRGVLARVLAESHRVLANGGIFMCLVPDGDRVMSLLQGEDDCMRFGHFQMRKCEGVHYDNAAPAYGLPYCFSLGDEGCTEFVLLPALLDAHFRELGMQPVWHEASQAAQDFFLAQPDAPSVAAGITKDQPVSHTDWLTLGFFRLFVVRKT